MNDIPLFETSDIDPSGTYWFNICDTDKAIAFQEKYPNARVCLFGVDFGSGTDSTFSGDIQVTSTKL